MRKDYRKVSSNNLMSREASQTLGFKMYKDGKKIMFAGIVGLSLIGFNTIAHADDLTSDPQPSGLVVGTPNSEVTPNSDSASGEENSSYDQIQPVTPVIETTPVNQAVPTQNVPAKLPVVELPDFTQEADATATPAVNVPVSSTSEAGIKTANDDLNAVRGGSRSYPYQHEDPGTPLPPVEINQDLNAWAQKRANELAAIGAISHDDMANGRPGWVSPENLLDAPNYVDGTIAHGPEALYMQKTVDGAGNHVALGEENALRAAIQFWTDEANNNYDNAGHYLTEVSPLANIAGYAYSYDPITGAEIVVLELGYLVPNSLPNTGSSNGENRDSQSNVNSNAKSPVSDVNSSLSGNRNSDEGLSNVNTETANADSEATPESNDAVKLQATETNVETNAKDDKLPHTNEIGANLSAILAAAFAMILAGLAVGFGVIKKLGSRE